MTSLLEQTPRGKGSWSFNDLSGNGNGHFQHSQPLFHHFNHHCQTRKYCALSWWKSCSECACDKEYLTCESRKEQPVILFYYLSQSCPVWQMWKQRTLYFSSYHKYGLVLPTLQESWGCCGIKKRGNPHELREKLAFLTSKHDVEWDDQSCCISSNIVLGAEPRLLRSASDLTSQGKLPLLMGCLTLLCCSCSAFPALFLPHPEAPQLQYALTLTLTPSCCILGSHPDPRYLYKVS